MKRRRLVFGRETNLPLFCLPLQRKRLGRLLTSPFIPNGPSATGNDQHRERSRLDGGERPSSQFPGQIDVQLEDSQPLRHLVAVLSTKWTRHAVVAPSL